MSLNVNISIVHSPVSSTFIAIYILIYISFLYISSNSGCDIQYNNSTNPVPDHIYDVAVGNSTTDTESTHCTIHSGDEMM